MISKIKNLTGHRPNLLMARIIPVISNARSNPIPSCCIQEESSTKIKTTGHL